MLMPPKFLSLSALVVALFGVAGCQAPCDSYCETAGEYISYCLENGSQGEWVAADWSSWGNFTGTEDYVADCQEDLAAQIEGGDADVLNGNCTDQASAYREMSDRGLCADLP
jgi:hypothetical protein